MNKLHRVIAIVNVVFALAVCQRAQAQNDVDLPLDKLLSTKISTAAKYDQAMSDVAASVTIISSEEIQRYGWTTFDELLNAIRGTYISSDRNYSYLGVRGVSRPSDSNSRLLVLLDGIPLDGISFGEAPIGNLLGLDLSSIERVEFVRGPGSALYGTGAMLAVINVITRKASEIAGANADIIVGSKDRHQAAMQFGKTFGSGLGLAGAVNWNETNGGNLYYPQFDSPATNNGVAKGLDFENMRTAMMTLTYGQLKLWGITKAHLKGIPTASYGTNFDQYAQTSEHSQMLGADYTKHVASNKQFDLRTYWLRQSAHGVYPYDDIGNDRSKGIRYGMEARFRWDLALNQTLVAGTELTRAPVSQYSYVLGDYQINLTRPYSVASFYLQDEYQPFKRVSIVAGIRHDKFSYSKGSTNPRLAVIYTPRETTSLKLLYGSAFRAPSMYELEYGDPVYGKKNESLKPEGIHTLEAVMEQRLSRDTFLVFSAYRMKAARLIEPVIDPADGLVQYQNIGESDGHGYEVELNMRRKDGLWAYGSYSYQQSSEAGQWMTNSPHDLIKAGVSTNPWARFHGALEVSYISRRRTVQDTVTDGATLVHATASAAIARHTRLILTVRNLFNVDYSSPVGPEFTQAAIAQDGRTFALSISFLP